MDLREYRTVFLAAILAAVVMAAGHLGLLTPEGRIAFQANAALWWQEYHQEFWMGVVALVLFLLALFVPRMLRRRREQRDCLDRVAQGPTLYLLPRSDWRPIQPGNVQVWTRMADALPHDEHLSFEVCGNEDGLFFALHASPDGLRAAMTQFKSEWPGLHSRVADQDPALLPEGWHAWWVELSPANADLAIAAMSDDPLRAALIEINAVLGQGRGLMQMIARRNYGMKKSLGQKAFAARDEETKSKGVRAIRQQEARPYEERAAQSYLDVTLRTVGLADTEERAQGIARGLARSISASFSGNNPVQPIRQGRAVDIVLKRLPGRQAPWAASELAYLAHLAGSDLIQLAPRLNTAPARYLPADPEMRLVLEKHRTAFMEVK